MKEKVYCGELRLVVASCSVLQILMICICFCWLRVTTFLSNSFFAFFVVVEEMSGKWSTEVLPRFIKIIMTEGETTSGELAPEAGLWITKVPG